MNKPSRIISLLGACFLLATIIKVTPVNERLENTLFELSELSGQYHENEIVVDGLSKSQFLDLARNTNSDYLLDPIGGTNGRLLLNEETSIADIYQEYPHLLSSFSLNYNAYVAGRTTLNPTDEPKYLPEQSYLRHINVESVWTKTKGEGLTIAIIDTGINYQHSEFKDSFGNSIITTNSYSVDNNKTVQEAGYEIINDTFFHGTMVAGLIAAQINSLGMAGIAPDVSLMIIKCGVNENGQFISGVAGLSSGLQYAIDNGADIINMSVETTANSFSSRLKTAVQNNIIVVGSAGNGVDTAGTYIGTSLARYPAADPNCIGVGALDVVSDTTTEYARATYSNYGINTTVMAPGTRIHSTWKYDTSANQYGNADGTSFACPMVTGIIALYKSLNPGVTFTEINDLIKASSKDLGDLGKDTDFGFGLIDADALINGEQGSLVFEYLDSNVTNTSHAIIKGKTSQIAPATIANGREIEGWYYNASFSGNKYNPYIDILNDDTTLYANYVDGTGIAVSSISVNPTSVSLMKNDSKQLDVTFFPSNATNKALTFLTSNQNVATVSSTGLITAVSAGTATISVASVADNTKTASCVVTVMEIGSLKIGRANFPGGNMVYGTIDNWTSTTSNGIIINGSADLYSQGAQTTMQVSNTSSIAMYHNTDPMPGPITGISIEHGGGDQNSRTYYAYANTLNVITSTSGNPQVGSLTVSTSNQNPRINMSEANNYRFFSLNLTSGSSSINSITIDYIYTATTPEPKTLDSITVVGTLDKSTYYVGEIFDPAGIQILANYSDDSNKTVEYNDLTFTPQILSLGTTSIEVTYQEGEITKNVIITGITVLEVPLTNLQLFIAYLETIDCNNILDLETYTQLLDLYGNLNSLELEQFANSTLSSGANAYERYEYLVFFRTYKEAQTSPSGLLLSEENTKYLIVSLIIIIALLSTTYILKKRENIEE